MRRDMPIFYDHKIETMSRSDLDALQLTKLKWQVDRCYHRSDFYRERFDAAGVSPADVKTLDDIRKFPFVHKEELREEQAQHPFLGRFTVAPEAAFREVHPSTGTTGTPVNTIWSATDVAIYHGSDSEGHSGVSVSVRGIFCKMLLRMGFGWRGWLCTMPGQKLAAS